MISIANTTKTLFLGKGASNYAKLLILMVEGVSTVV